MRVYIRREKPFRVFILPVRADKVLKVPVGEIPRPIQDAIEEGLRDGNDGFELGGWGRWEEWDEFNNDMRMKELAEILSPSVSAGGLGGLPRELHELLILIRDGID